MNFAVAELTTRETVSTSAIEGVKLDPDEVRSSIMQRLGLGASDTRADRLSSRGERHDRRTPRQHTKPAVADAEETLRLARRHLSLVVHVVSSEHRTRLRRRACMYRACCSDPALLDPPPRNSSYNAVTYASDPFPSSLHRTSPVRLLLVSMTSFRSGFLDGTRYGTEQSYFDWYGPNRLTTSRRLSASLRT